jgi:PilZ domain
MRLEGRTERRVAMAIPVRLVTAGRVHVTEQVFTVNTSPHGARVKTKRRWHPDERPRLASRSGKLLTYAKIVYCEPLPDGTFCIGLKFQSPLPEHAS